MRIQIQVGHEVAKVHQSFSSMAEVLSIGFGGKKSEGDAPNGVVVPQTEAELEAVMRQMNGA